MKGVFIVMILKNKAGAIMFDLNLMNSLTEAHGPSGRENEVRQVLYQALKNDCDDLYFDGLGSLIARLNKQATGPKIALIAHMDEVGFLVQKITDDGYLKLFKLGGIDPLIALNSEIEIKMRSGNKIKGIVFSDKPYSHLNMDDLFVDIGASCYEQVERMGVEIGDSAVFATRSQSLNDTGNFVAKSFDDRIGCLLGVELMRRLSKQDLACDLYFVATAQEEIGTKGGHTAIETLKPDLVFVIDVASTKHTPNAQTKSRVYGKGPCLVVADKGALGHYGLFNHVCDVAKEKAVRVQRDFLLGGGTDNGAATLTNGGLAGLAIVLPVKNCHTPYTLFHQDDYLAARYLLEHVLRDFNETHFKQITQFNEL